MANQLSTNPISISADLASFQSAQTLRSGQTFGLSISKITLAVGSAASVAGQVTITDPVTGTNLLAPILVAGGTAAETIIYDDTLSSPLSWADFKVTGVTATGTVLYIWYKA